MATVSVIIPCYNQGQFVDEAVNSVLEQGFEDIEIIIINDGSTDSFTNHLLEGYDRANVRVIFTKNNGLAAARNGGIKAATGKYILPLDADDKIGPGYIEKAVDLLEKNSDLGIVYCRASLFGAVETDWDLPEYSLERMLIDNIIFCSAFFRREDWLAVGGYDVGMIYGWEDYSFWLSLIERGRQVYQIPEPLFIYRVASDSMVRSKEKWQKIEMFKRIFKRHQDLFSNNIEVWINALLDTRDVYYTSRLYVDCGEGLSDEKSVSRKIEHGTREIVFNVCDYNSIAALRFDPVDTYAILDLEKVILRYGSGKERIVQSFQCNELYADGSILIFDTEDPQCCFSELAPVDLKDVSEIVVYIRFQALAQSALEYLVEYQREMIRSIEEQKIEEKIKNMGRSIVHSVTQYLKR